jgi:hypothetical protein
MTDIKSEKMGIRHNNFRIEKWFFNFKFWFSKITFQSTFFFFNLIALITAHKRLSKLAHAARKTLWGIVSQILTNINLNWATVMSFVVVWKTS